MPVVKGNQPKYRFIFTHLGSRCLDDVTKVAKSLWIMDKALTSVYPTILQKVYGQRDEVWTHNTDATQKDVSTSILSLNAKFYAITINKSVENQMKATKTMKASSKN